jgi:hypothetical protein
MNRRVRIVGLALLLAIVLAVSLAAPTVKFKGKNLRVTLLLYCDLPTASACNLAAMRLTCTGDDCVGPLIAKFYSDEFKRYTHTPTRVVVQVVPPQGRGRMVIDRPRGVLDAVGFYKRIIGEFRARDASYFGSDARLFVNIVAKDPSDRSESSLASSTGRVGLVEWNAAPGRKIFIWNMCKTLHELGHIWGATDHYLRPSKSMFPEGYFDPALGEKGTQTFVDIMSGTRPVDGRQHEADPESVAELRIGPKTAEELGWSER